jgi:hypothetical protein
MRQRLKDYCCKAVHLALGLDPRATSVWARTTTTMTVVGEKRRGTLKAEA